MEIKTEEFYFAFVDLLASTKTIQNDNDNEFLNKLKRIYDSCRRIENAFYHDIIIKIYSDNISFAMKADRNVDDFVRYISYMLQFFLKNGLLPRGGICKGQLYIDDVFVLGKALTEAYKMESNDAIYPRVILSEEVASEISDYVKKDLVFVDEIDGEKILNLFTPYGVNPSQIKQSVLEVRSWFDKTYSGIKKSGNNKISQKYYWLNKYLKKLKKNIAMILYEGGKKYGIN